MTETIALVLVISAFLLGLCACGIIVYFSCALVKHFFPNCAFSKWIDAEFFQTEDLTFAEQQQDWIAKRMSK